MDAQIVSQNKTFNAPIQGRFAKKFMQFSGDQAVTAVEKERLVERFAHWASSFKKIKSWHFADLSINYTDSLRSVFRAILIGCSAQKGTKIIQPSIGMVAQKAGLSRPTTEKAIKALVAIGVLCYKHQYKKNGHWRTNRYFIPADLFRLITIAIKEGVNSLIEARNINIFRANMGWNAGKAGGVLWQESFQKIVQRTLKNLDTRKYRPRIRKGDVNIELTRLKKPVCQKDFMDAYRQMRANLKRIGKGVVVSLAGFNVTSPKILKQILPKILPEKTPQTLKEKSNLNYGTTAKTNQHLHCLSSVINHINGFNMISSAGQTHSFEKKKQDILSQQNAASKDSAANLYRRWVGLDHVKAADLKILDILQIKPEKTQAKNIQIYNEIYNLIKNQSLFAEQKAILKNNNLKMKGVF